MTIGAELEGDGLNHAFGEDRRDVVLESEEEETARATGAGGERGTVERLHPRLRGREREYAQGLGREVPDWGLVRTVPRIRQLRVTEQPFRYLSDEELSALVNAAPSAFWRLFFLFLARTGCRFGEAAGLCWEDVHLDETPCVRIHRAAAAGVIGPTKTGKARTVPLAPDIADALRRVRHADGLVFPRQSGGPMRPDSTKDVLHRACDRAGLARIGWHALRHTFATMLCARNVPISQIQRLLGHSTILMTTRYAHVRQEDLHLSVNRAFGDAARGEVATRWSPAGSN